MKRDVIGDAMLDYMSGEDKESITTYLRLPWYEAPVRDSFPTKYLFRGYDEMPALEQEALGLCRGKVLDIGCGAGSHSLYLRQKGIAVTSLDQSAGAVQTCRLRGLASVVQGGILQYNGTKFDTLLLLMNGIGIAGTLEKLETFLRHLKSLLQEKGQIIVDSSDIVYMYQNDADSTFQIQENGPYYGEGRFIMEYKGKKGGEFPWLYIDYERLSRAAGNVGMECRLVSSGLHYDYLARLLVES
jgi:SAM-dependent methyltransferase